MTEGIENLKIGWNLDNSYARLPGAFFSVQKPTPVQNPAMIIFNEPLAAALGLNLEEVKSEASLDIFAGNTIPEGGKPIAQAYAGHQFGHFTMLGDGRALLLGEQLTPYGERFDIQLKGSGRTSFSRGGDGRAALGPMLREYLISEAMHALDIPTTRSLAVVTTGESIMRETALPGAILTRVASSHIRVGTFQYAAGKGDVEQLKILADYTIKRHYPYVEDAENPYHILLKEVIKRQAELIAKWQLVGFIHGVMNTDNMTISGETIDYGPCAFMDIYDPETVFSSIDTRGRYAYGNQPYIAAWNLARFAESLLPLLHKEQEEGVKLAQEEISRFSGVFEENWLMGMRAKLGIFNEEKEDQDLINALLRLMKENSADYTNTFRSLTLNTPVESKLGRNPEFAKWHELWQVRLERQEESKVSSIELMKRSNPGVIPRNHRVEEALNAAVNGDYSLMKKLNQVLSTPYAYSFDQEEYCSLPEPSNLPYQTFCGT